MEMELSMDLDDSLRSSSNPTPPRTAIFTTNSSPFQPIETPIKTLDHSNSCKKNTQKNFMNIAWEDEEDEQPSGIGENDPSHPDPQILRKQVEIRFRRMAHDSLQKNQPRSAVFYANKVVALSNGALDDVWLLGQAYFVSREYQRAVHMLTKHKVLDSEGESCTPLSHLRFYLLAAQCLAAIKQWEECLDLLEKITEENFSSRNSHSNRFLNNSTLSSNSMASDNVIITTMLKLADDVKNINSLKISDNSPNNINVVASLCFIKGEAYEATENREKCVFWYKLALKCDVYCAEAFFQLIDNQMLTTKEEKMLINTLDFKSDPCLRELYCSNINKYDSKPDISEKFKVLEEDYGLEKHVELASTKAEVYFYQHDTDEAYKLSKWVREEDPFNYRVIPVYISTLVELGKKSELFSTAHQLVETYPDKAVSWYAIGCYYLLIRKLEIAQRYFHKSTSLDPNFAPAWIGFGNAFAAQDESEQAMCSYRTASRLFRGCHLPLLCMGMEYLRTNNLVLALQFLQQSLEICPVDPLIFNELGSVYFKQQQFQLARDMYLKTLALTRHLPQRLMQAWESTVFNLGHVYRKLRCYDKALVFYQKALCLHPKKASTHVALGFTHQLLGEFEKAIESYHTALGLRSDDMLASHMLSIALEEAFSSVDFINGQTTPIKNNSFSVLNDSSSTSLSQSSNWINSSQLAESNLNFSFNSSADMSVDMSL